MSLSEHKWRDHFLSMSVETFIKDLGDFNLVSCDASDSIVTALKTLTKNNILSMPVRNDAGEFTAFIDVVDIVAAAARLFEEKSGLGDFYAVASNDVEISKKTVGDVVGRSNRNPFFPVSPSDSVLDVVTILATRGVHRVPVVAATGDVVGIVTQSNVIDYVDSHTSIDPIRLEKAISDLGIGSRDVVSVYGDDTRALQAFRLMDFARVSGVAVLDDDGSLLAVLSAKDLRVVASGNSDQVHFSDLLLSAREFAAIAHAPDQLGRKVSLGDSKALHPLASACHESESLARVVHKLRTSKIHRLFVVDDTTRPSGCIALRDVLTALIK